EIRQALLPLPGDAKSQPALATTTQVAATQTTAPAEDATVEATTESDPAMPTPLSPYTNYPDLKPPSTPMPPSVESEVETKAGSTMTEGPAVVNSAPIADASTGSSPVNTRPRPQSPYPNYPDFKPPSSPSPKYMRMRRLAQFSYTLSLIVLVEHDDLGSC
ncbi:hypothetical protein ACJX0J_027744, partial [Zea mays]